MRDEGWVVDLSRCVLCTLAVPHHATQWTPRLAPSWTLRTAPAGSEHTRLWWGGTYPS